MTRIDYHALSLDHIIHDLTRIHERPADVTFIIREGIWCQGTSHQMEFPDLIVGYRGRRIDDDDFCVPIELKHCRDKREKALHQLTNGAIFAETELNKMIAYGLFVVYNEQFQYDVEKIRREALIR